MTQRGKDRRRDAFTLLELMIVLVILVLLAAVAGRRLLRSQKKAEINIAKSQISELEAALMDYNLDMRSFPSSEDGLQALVESPSEERAADKWDGPYFKDLPVDPWGNDFQYEYPPTRNSQDSPDIWSYGPDGEPDTDDDIGNWGAGSGEAGEEEGMSEDVSSKRRPSETRERPPAREPGSGGAGRSGAGSSREKSK